MPQIKVCAAICREAGVVTTMYSTSAFKQADIATFIVKIRNYFGPAKKVAIFLDNASYHKTALVKQAGVDNNVKLVYNMPYRPDLNGIELLWRRSKVAYYNFVDSFRAMGGRRWDQLNIVKRCVEEVPREHVQKIAEGGWARLGGAEPILAQVRPWEINHLVSLTAYQHWWSNVDLPASWEELQQDLQANGQAPQQ